MTNTTESKHTPEPWYFCVPGNPQSPPRLISCLIMNTLPYQWRDDGEYWDYVDRGGRFADDRPHAAIRKAEVGAE